VPAASVSDEAWRYFWWFCIFADTLKHTVETIAAARRLNVAITINHRRCLKVAEACGREAGLGNHTAMKLSRLQFLALPVTGADVNASGMIRVLLASTPEQKLELIGLLKEQVHRRLSRGGDKRCSRP